MAELAARVQALILSGARESTSLDYKRDPYPATEGGRKEFAKDLSGFANRDGGILIVGVREEDGAPAEIVGVQPELIDGTIQWMESVARSGITPHLPGLLINEIEYEGRRLLAVAVPQGHDPPYEVASAGARFFVRDERSVRTMSREEIKFAARRGADLTQRIDAFVAERTKEFIDRAVAGTSTPHMQGALLVVMPVFDETLSYRFDLPTVVKLVPHMTSFEGQMVASGKPRIDGLLYEFEEIPGHLRGHGFLFRHGAVELVDGYVCGRREALPGLLLMNGLIESVRRSIELCHTVTGADTFTVDFRMIVSQGQKIAFFNDWQRGHKSVDRDELYFDRQVVTHEQFCLEAPAAVMRSLLDQVWQAFGYVNCGYFKEDGSYQPPR